MNHHLDVIIYTEDATEQVGTARVDYRPWASEIILRDVDFNTNDAKTAVIEGLRADVDWYARRDNPEPTNAEKLNAIWDAWSGDFNLHGTLGEFLDEHGVTAPEET